ncbi:MAG TPA: carboxyl-terminal protease, partial [Flavihumibacter sp.]|nr:carboxyl-terminal protease [Flavihumibacter sp.]
MKSTPGKKKLQVWLPLLFSIVMVIGMVFGYKLRDNTNTARNLFDFKQKRSPLQEVFDLVTLKYVDTVNTDTLGNDAIQDMLSK